MSDVQNLPDDNLRQQSVWLLDELLIGDRPTLTKLIEALKDPEQCLGAVDTLSRWGPLAKSAIPALLRAYDSTEDGSLQSSILQALEQIGPGLSQAALPWLIDKAKTSKQAVWLRFLGKVGPSAEQAIPLVVDAIDNGEAGNRRSRLRLLGQLGPEGVKELFGRFKKEIEPTPEVTIIHDLLGCVRYLQPYGHEVVPILLDLLKKKKDHLQTRKAILFAIGDLRAGGRTAVPLLLTMLRSSNDADSWHAACALARIARTDRVVLAALRETVRDEKAPTVTRVVVCSLLCHIDGDAAATAPDLVKLLRRLPIEKKSRFRYHSLPIFDVYDEKALPPEQASDEMKSLFEESPGGDFSRWQPERELHIHLIQALAHLGPKANAAIPELIRILQTRKDDDGLRLYVAWCLGEMGSKAKPVAPALAAILQAADEPIELRQRAAALLAKFGSEGLTHLVTTIESADWAGRLIALETLEEMGPRAAKRSQQSGASRTARIACWPGWRSLRLLEFSVTNDQYNSLPLKLSIVSLATAGLVVIPLPRMPVTM